MKNFEWAAYFVLRREFRHRPLSGFQIKRQREGEEKGGRFLYVCTNTSSYEAISSQFGSYLLIKYFGCRNVVGRMEEW